MDTEATESSSCSKNCTEDASSLFNCKICWQLAEDPVVTQCGHLFCWFCLCSWLKSFSKCKECPVCRAIIEENKLVPLYGTESERKEAKDLDPNSEKSIPNRPIAPRPQTATLPNNEDYFPEDEDDFSVDDEDLNNRQRIKERYFNILGISNGTTGLVSLNGSLLTQQINKRAKIERKEDANTKTTRDVLSKRKPKPSAKNLSAALQAVINPLENIVGIQGQQ
uniref:E3 ubiquitin-protein ligase RMA n=1 Tax=Quercus lobata TaxID=97700 RepID=A0A7N2RDP3_QUELO